MKKNKNKKKDINYLIRTRFKNNKDKNIINDIGLKK